ncbi:MAG: pentapeptide repeat-containing protein [Desulfobulbaceae bacterium]
MPPLVLAALLIAGCGPVTIKEIEAQKGAKLLTAAEVLTLVEGNTLFLQAYGQDSYYYYDPSGALFGQDISNNKDTGKWDVSDSGELCMKLRWWWYGDLRCFPVYGDGQKYYMGSDAGVLAFTADVLPGDHKQQYRETGKAGKKSYRRAVQSQQPGAAAATEPVADPAAEQASGQPVVEVNPRQPVPPASAGELKATVKWMARDCPGCNLAGSNLKKADLVGAKLQGADLSGAELSMANLRRADLQGANLAGADLSLANMPGADLRGSNLQKANFKGANLIKADLTGAQLEGADFSEALLEGALGLPR